MGETAKRRKIDRAFFIATVYGVILGIVGNILVELVFMMYRKEIDLFGALIGLIACAIGLWYGFHVTYQISTELAQE